MTIKNDQVAPNDKDEYVTIQLHEKDLLALVQLLNVGYDTYTKVAENAVKVDDTKSATLFAARAKLSAAFSDRINSYLDFAEPKSKEMH